MFFRIENFRPDTCRIIVCLCAMLLAVFPGLSQRTIRSAVPSAATAVSSGSQESGGREGYLLNLEVQGGRTFFVGAAEIDNYVENKHLVAEDDWLLLLLNDRGENIGARRLRNPGSFSPVVFSGQGLPFTVKVPRADGLAEVAIYSQHLDEQIRIPIDSIFRSRASANRQEFLAFDRENRRLVAEETSNRRNRAGAVRSQSKEILRFENLPDDLRRRIHSEIVLEVEKLAQSGLQPADHSIVSLEAEPQCVVSGTVFGAGGAPVSGANLLLRQLSPTTTAARSWTAKSDSKGKYSISAPGNLEPSSFVLSAYASNYVLQSVGLEVTKDITYDFLLLRGNMISGIVRDSSEKVLRGARVRAYSSGMLVNSALSDTDGSYSFSLPEGVYEIEALPPAGTTMAPVTLRDIAVSAPYTADFVLPAAEGMLTVKLYYPSESIYSRFASKSLVRFELYQSGLTVSAGSGVTGQNGYDSEIGKYYRSYTHYLKNGAYSLVTFSAGCRPISTKNIEVAGDTAVSIDLPRPFLWTGRLLGADGAALAGMSVQSYTDLARENELTTTDSQGRFSILYTPNGFVKFFTDPGSKNIPRTERIGDATESRDKDVVLDAFPSFVDSGTPLTQIFGVPDRNSRWNIVMIGDGYTNLWEMYTDINNNGRWDGVLYYDLNKNGVWDTGEPYQRYGSASAPVNGTNPNVNNEPFTDLNGDGVPNLRDQELFDQNTLDTARSLFGQDEWWRHREAFNIFRIRLVSKQAGHKVMDANGKVVIQRDTILGTYLDTPERSYLFHANTTLVSQYINQYVPECDTRIVMVNQPIRMGRVNSYMFQYGGEISTLCNDYVVAHEMGHNVGLLSDEYTEYQETYVGNESASRNITSLRDPRTIPWRALISAGKEIPSCPGSRGVGLFEGAAYYTGGRYRPTEYCMMVSGNRYCPVCTNEIEIRLADITGNVPEALTLGPAASVSGLYPKFEWESITGISHSLLEVETADGSQLVASYDIYDTGFILPFPLAENKDYRWHIRPASAGRWGAWSSWTYFKPVSSTPLFMGIFPQIAAGGTYQTILTGINTGETAAGVDISLVNRSGILFEGLPDSGPNPVHFNIPPMGILRFPFTLPGDIAVGYARILSDMWIGGNALFRSYNGALIRSEAGVGLSKPTRHFMVPVDNTNNAASGYAVVNISSSAATLDIVLRDFRGVVRDAKNITLAPGGHLSEFAFERFPATAPAGFEGSLEFSSNQNVAAVALRYDNLHLQEFEHVFSSIPVLVDEMSTELFFPQVADGGGFRTDFVLVNTQESGTFVRLEFYRSDGAPQSLPINGSERTFYDLPLAARGVAHFVTDGTSTSARTGWVKVMCPNAVFGSAIFQTHANNKIISEAGVASSPATKHFATHVDSLGAANSGLAICNPYAADAVLTLNLRRSDGQIVATGALTLPVGGHVARFFTEWFPRGFDEFEGTLEVIATEPVSAVALRFDNPGGDVFATLPVVILP